MKHQVPRRTDYMKNIEYSKSPGVPHGSMDEEFLTHKHCSEWWYCTGYLRDEKERMYMYQFTLAKIKLFGINFHVLLTALTDIENKKHDYGQKVSFLGRNIVTTSNRTSYRDIAEMTYMPHQFGSKGKMQLDMKGKNYELKLDMNAVKPPVWHCEDGVLKMGLVDDPKQRTYYFSYTNLETNGTLVLNGEELHVSGKSWFDKQGGTYTIDNPLVNWEWFSMRFFDNTELMLFSFPQDNYFDGTKINIDGSYSRLNNYSVTPQGFIEAGGYKFSNGWTLHIPGVKDEDYTLEPVIEGQFNLFFFELLAYIKNRKGETVGYAVVELLPGVYNKKIDSFKIFHRTK